MKEQHMNSVITELSKIELATVHIMEAAEKKKAMYLVELEKQKKELISKIDLETQNKIDQFNECFNTKNKKALEQFQVQEESVLAKLENTYNENHTIWAQEILNNLIKE